MPGNSDPSGAEVDTLFLAFMIRRRFPRLSSNGFRYAGTRGPVLDVEVQNSRPESASERLLVVFHLRCVWRNVYR